MVESLAESILTGSQCKIVYLCQNYQPSRFRFHHIENDGIGDSQITPIKPDEQKVHKFLVRKKGDPLDQMHLNTVSRFGSVLRMVLHPISPQCTQQSNQQETSETGLSPSKNSRVFILPVKCR